MSENNDGTTEINSQSTRQTVLRSGVLRPSVLGAPVLGSGNGSTAASGPTTDSTKEKVVVSNPFMKEQKDDAENAEAEGAAGGGGGDAFAKNEEAQAESKKKDEDDEEPDERPDPLTLLRKNGLERANLFAAAKNSIPRVEKSGFVFGQNVHERVVGENISADSASKSTSSDSGSTAGELLFSSVIQNAAKTSSDADSTTTKEKDTEAKSLTDVAREYEESRAQKRKYEEVATFTGEENELNIVDINCKLFAFVNSNWEERGRGSLRLNDSINGQECSRVVFRTSGNLRLLLNTKVWAGMVAERPSQKSLRLTAMDNTGKIKIFLLMARPVDINQVHKALVERIDARKASHPNECQPAEVDNNGTEDKNGATCFAETANAEMLDGDDADADDGGLEEEATAASEPKTDDSTEPSPKKTLITATTTDTNN